MKYERRVNSLGKIDKFKNFAEIALLCEFKVL